MGRKRGIIGFETGRDDTGMTLTGSDIALSTTGQRTGLYCLRDRKTVAAAAGFATITDSTVITDGAVFEIKLRAFFKVDGFPSSNNYKVAGIVAGISHYLEMDTTGLLRMNCSLETASSYSGQTIVGHWYSAELRFNGLNKEAAVATSGRQRASIEVYDWGLSGEEDPVFLEDFATGIQTATIQANINCIGGFFVAVGDALQSVDARTSNFHLQVSNATQNPCLETGDGDYANFTSETTAEGVTCVACGPVTNGSVLEQGLLNGFDIINYLKSNTSVTGAITFTVGNTGGGPVCTRDIYYDDIWYDIQYGTDVPDQFDSEFPEATFVNPYGVVAQGTYDLFSPAGGFGQVDNIPMDDSGNVQGTVTPQATAYQHVDLDASDYVEHMRVHVRWQGTALTQQIILYENTTPLVLDTVSGVVPAVLGNIQGDYPRQGVDSIDSVIFNVTEYGVKILLNGTVNLHSIFMEVLTGTNDMIFIDGGVDGSGQIQGGLDLGEVAAATGALVLITDGSGLYSFTPGQFFDELYTRNVATNDTLEVQIPDPFWESFYLGD